MAKDAIVDEVRAIKRRLAAKFGYDVQKIGRDIQRRQRKSGRKVVSLCPKRATG